MPARKKQSADAPAPPAKGGRKKTTTANGAALILYDCGTTPGTNAQFSVQ